MTDPNVDSVVHKMREREALGMKKYGRTTASGYDRLTMLRHAQEEAMDLAIYLEELIRQEGRR